MLQSYKKRSRKLFAPFRHPAFIYLTVVGNLALLTAATTIYFLEKDMNPTIQTWFDALWWGASTITTIGYGDVVPATIGGRIVGLFLMFTGTILFITFTGTLVLLWTRQEVESELNPIKKEVFKEEEEQKRIERLLIEIKTKLDHLKK